MESASSDVLFFHYCICLWEEVKYSRGILLTIAWCECKANIKALEDSHQTL